MIGGKFKSIRQNPKMQLHATADSSIYIHTELLQVLKIVFNPPPLSTNAPLVVLYGIWFEMDRWMDGWDGWLDI